MRRRIELENAPTDLLADVWLAEVARLLPELVERYPDLPQPVSDAATGRGRLFEAVARLLHALSERAPVVLFIDDLQSADSASVDLLHYCAQRWVELGTRLLLLCTLRDAGQPGLVAELERALPVRRIEVAPLTAQDTLAWIGEDRGQEAFGRWLYAETGGNPFITGETLKMLLETGSLVESHSTGNGLFDFDVALARETELRGILPPRVREVVRARLARLPQPAISVLAAAAVLGQDGGSMACARSPT